MSTPTLFGTPKTPVQIAGLADGFTSFGRVVLNDLGEVAFEASIGSTFGVYTGPNPVTDKVLATGDVRGAELFSWIRLGELSNAGSLTLLTSDFHSTDRQVWRVDDLFVPPPPPPPPPPSPSHGFLRDLIRRLLQWLFHWR